MYVVWEFQKSLEEADIMSTKHLKHAISLFFLLSLLSCVTPQAVFQSKTYKPHKKGIISYSLDFNLFQPDAVQKRKIDARIKMEEFCGPEEPVIISERKSQKTSGYYTNTSYRDHSDHHSIGYNRAHRDHFSSSSGSASTVSRPIVHTYNIISFECK